MNTEEKTPPVRCDNCGDLLDLKPKDPLNVIIEMEPAFQIQFFCPSCASAGLGIA